MPLILLGLLVIAGLLVYMYYTGELGNLSSRKSKKKETESSDEDEEIGKVIYLPNDVEKEKKKRHVKTGKD
jgi:FtsZ-interacting cell division protein ZipA